MSAEQNTIATGVKVDGKRRKIVDRMCKLLKSTVTFRTLLNRSKDFRFDITQLMSYGLNIDSEYTIRILPKSDPLAAMTGSETASCMSFNSTDGKNNVYLFNLNTSFLVLAKKYIDERGMARERVLATSVITGDRKTPVNAADLKNIIEQAIKEKKSAESINLREILGEDFIDRISPDVYMSADNVEAGLNMGSRQVAGMPFEQFVKEQYQRLFKAYIAAHPTTRGGRPINKTKVPVGYSNSDLLKSLRREPNQYLMQAPVAYSDKVQSDVEILDIEVPEEQAIPPFTGIKTLTSEDTLEVSFIEDIAFSDTPFKNHLAGIEMELMAAEMNEAVKGERRRNLSLGYFENGKLLGFIMAYAGYDKANSKEVIYIANFAVLRPEGVAGGKLLRALAAKIHETAGMFRETYGYDIPILFYTTTHEKGSFGMLRPTRKSAARMISEHARSTHLAQRLTRYGFKIVSEQPLPDSSVDFVLHASRDVIPSAEAVSVDHNSGRSARSQ
jgi:hypothetical protein